MTIFTPRAVLLAIALLGGSTLLASTSPLLAQPRSSRDSRSNGREGRPTPGRDNHFNRDTRRSDSNQRKVPNPPRTYNRSGSTYRPGSSYNSSGRTNRPTYRPGSSTNRRNGFNRPGSTYRPRQGVFNRPGSFGGYNGRGIGNSSGYNRNIGGGSTRSYTGQVTNVRSSQSFDVRVGGDTFNVYANSRVPRGLSVGDFVQVNGEKMYSNDIRNASVTLIRNR